MVKTLSFIAIGCVLNQSHEHWFLGNSLHLFITKMRVFRDEVVDAIVPNNMGDLEANAFDEKLGELMVHMKLKVLEVLQPFMSFLDGFEKNMGHNMLLLMLNPRFKSLQLVTNYIGHDKTSTLVVQYDVGLLLPLLIQCYKILMGHLCLASRFT
jgi:hypothetical protein